MHETNNSNKTGGMNFDLDEAISQDMRHLERLASFYYRRGDFARAAELNDVIDSFREQEETRKQRYDANRQNSRRSDSLMPHAIETADEDPM